MLMAIGLGGGSKGRSGPLIEGSLLTMLTCVLWSTLSGGLGALGRDLAPFSFPTQCG